MFTYPIILILFACSIGRAVGLPVNEAVMVTVELNFGAAVPSVASAMQEVERQQSPEDGRGRVFSIIEAYGEPTADGKKLHLSMHVSTEKPGVGALVFRRTGEILWQKQIVAGSSTNHFSNKHLTILLDNGQKKSFVVDGSRNPTSILAASLRGGSQTVRDLWPDNAEREVSFIYSACGCPVKVMARRVGDRTVRTKELPVIFPDDPAVVQVIEKLMGWKASSETISAAKQVEQRSP